MSAGASGSWGESRRARLTAAAHAKSRRLDVLIDKARARAAAALEPDPVAVAAHLSAAREAEAALGGGYVQRLLTHRRTGAQVRILDTQAPDAPSGAFGGAQTDARADGRTNGQIDGQIDGRSDGQIDGRIERRVDARTESPDGAHRYALECTTHQSRRIPFADLGAALKAARRPQDWCLHCSSLAASRPKVHQRAADYARQVKRP